MSNYIYLVEEHELCAHCVQSVSNTKKSIRKTRSYVFYPIQEKKKMDDIEGLNDPLVRKERVKKVKTKEQEQRDCAVCQCTIGLYQVRDSRNLCSDHRKEMAEMMRKTIIDHCGEA